MTNPDPFDLPPPQEAPAPSNSIVDLHGLIRMVLDRSWLIVTCVVVAVIAAAGYLQIAPRVYEGTTTIQVEQEDAKVLDAKAVVDPDMRGLEIMNTVAQALCSATVMEQVLDDNNMLPPEGTVVTIQGKPVTRAGIVRLFSRSVRTTVRRNTRLIDTTVRNTDPALAARLADEVVAAYLGEDARSQQTTTTNVSDFLAQEADRQRTNYLAAEQQLQDFREKKGLISLNATTDTLRPKLQDLNRHLTDTNSSLLMAKGAYEDSLKMDTNVQVLLAYPQIAADPDVMQVRFDLARAQSDFMTNSLRYREKNPKYIRAKATLDGFQSQLADTVLRVRARIQTSLRLTYENTLTSSIALQKQVAQTESNIWQLSDLEVQLNPLLRDRDEAKELLDTILKRQGETAVAAKAKPAKIVIIQRAQIPELPSSPRVKLIFALAVFGGLAAGLAVSFLLESMNTSFRTVDEVENYLGMPVLGTVPKLPKAETPEAKLVAAEGVNSTGAEVFRTLRTTLSMLGRESERRSYLFTSSMPGEGKTFTSINYAGSLAQQGKRTLIMDLDLRRPMVEAFFTGKRNKLPGVTDYFLGRKKLEEVCLPHPDLPNLFWLPAGALVPSPLELLTQSDFPQLLQEALARFDKVIIDTAPVLPVSDTLLLASKVQTVALVVHGGKTSRKAVERSIQLLKKANSPLGGVVLNLLPNRRFAGGYYYAYYHGYGYGHYGYGRRKEDKDKASIDA